MDVWHITVAALRRWYILLPLLTLTVFGAFLVGAGVQPQYEVTATTTLVPGTADPDAISAYGNMFDTNQVLSIVAGATPARQAIEGQGLDSEYEIDFRDRSAVMNVMVLSDSRQESLATGEAVIELTRQELAQRQDAAGIPPGAQMGLQVLQPPSVSDVVSEGKVRNMAIVGIVGAALSLLVAVLLDDLVGLLKRRRRHARDRADAKKDNPDQLLRRRHTSAKSDKKARHPDTPAQTESLEEQEPAAAQVVSNEPDPELPTPSAALQNDRAHVDQGSSKPPPTIAPR